MWLTNFTDIDNLAKFIANIIANAYIYPLENPGFPLNLGEPFCKFENEISTDVVRTNSVRIYTDMNIPADELKYKIEAFNQPGVCITHSNDYLSKSTSMIFPIHINGFVKQGKRAAKPNANAFKIDILPFKYADINICKFRSDLVYPDEQAIADNLVSLYILSDISKYFTLDSKKTYKFYDFPEHLIKYSECILPLINLDVRFGARYEIAMRFTEYFISMNNKIKPFYRFTMPSESPVPIRGEWKSAYPVITTKYNIPRNKKIFTPDYACACCFTPVYEKCYLIESEYDGLFQHLCQMCGSFDIKTDKPIIRYTINIPTKINQVIDLLPLPGYYNYKNKNHLTHHAFMKQILLFLMNNEPINFSNSDIYYDDQFILAEPNVIFKLGNQKVIVPVILYKG